MTADLASLGFAIDSNPLVSASREMDRMAVSAGRAEAATRGLEASANRMARAANENAAALGHSQRSLAAVNAMLEQSIAAHVRAEAAMGRWRSAAAEGGKSATLAAHQVGNLRQQFLDVAVSLQGGMNPLTVLFQQGGQIASVFGPGTGVTGVLRGVGGELGRLATSTAGLGTLAIGSIATVAAAYDTWDKSQKAVQIGLTGLGRQSGITANQIELIAQTTDLSVSSARELATAFASTGNASTDTIRTAIEASRDFATTFGTGFEDAGKIQLEFFQDAGAAFDKYGSRLGVWSSSTSKLLNDLQRQGRGTEAVRVAFDQINPALAKYSELAATSTKATDTLKDAFSNLWQGLSSGTGNLTRLLAGSVGTGVGVTDTVSVAAAARAGELARQRAVQERATSVAIEIDRANQVANNNPVRRQTLENIDRAGLRNLPPTPTEMRERFDDVFARGAQASTGSFGQFPTTYGDLEKRMRESLDVKPKSPDELRTQIGTLTQQGTDISQARALDDVQRQATRTHEAQARAMGRTAGEAERLTTRAGLLNRATADGIPLSAENARRIDAIADAYGRQTQKLAEAALQRETLFERDQLGRSQTEQVVAARLRPVYGDDLSSKPAQLAAAQIRVNDELRQTQMLYSSLANMGSGLIDPLIDSTRSWSDAFGDLSKQMSRAVLQAAVFGQGPFAAMMGTQGAGAGPGGVFGGLVGGGGGFGGIFRGLFGGGSYGAAQYQSAAAAAAPGAYGPGFDRGGYTGPGGRLEVAGVVHREEVVWSREDVSRAGGVGVVEAMRRGLRGYADGDVVGDRWQGMPPQVPAPAQAAAPPPQVVVQPTQVHFIGAPPGTQAREVSDGRGSRRLEVTFDEAARASEMRRRPPMVQR